MASLRSPVFTGSTNQQQIISGQVSPLGNTYVGAPPSSAVASSDLPPPSGAAMSPAVAYAEPEIGPDEPRPTAYTPPSASAANARPRQLGAPPSTLNQQAARLASTQAAPAPMRGGGTVHTVQPGDTAWNISQRYGISVDQLAAANGGSVTVRLGSRIAIPGASGAPQPRVQVASLDPQAGMAAPLPAAAPSVPQTAVAERPAAPLARAREQEQVAALPSAAAPAGAMAPAVPQPQATPSDAVGFRWPVRGRIISGFGKKADGERNDGINLAVPEGTAVKAAEDGTVIYAGNELKSYGNLVLVRHNGGWVSAYAHNSDLKVKRGDKVRRGQVIALSGMSGGVTTPQVHFELRKDAAPVDPLKHLSET